MDKPTRNKAILIFKAPVRMLKMIGNNKNDPTDQHCIICKLHEENAEHMVKKW